MNRLVIHVFYLTPFEILVSLFQQGERLAPKLSKAEADGEDCHRGEETLSVEFSAPAGMRGLPQQAFCLCRCR